MEAPKKGHPATPRQREAGKKNLEDWKRKVATGEIDPFVPGPEKGRSLERWIKERTAKDQRIRAFIEAYLREATAELGGEDKLTMFDRALLHHQKVALSFILLAEKYMHENQDVISPSADLKPYKILLHFLKTFREGQLALVRSPKVTNPERRKGAMTRDDVLAQWRAVRGRTGQGEEGKDEGGRKDAETDSEGIEESPDPAPGA